MRLTSRWLDPRPLFQRNKFGRKSLEDANPALTSAPHSQSLSITRRTRIQVQRAANSGGKMASPRAYRIKAAKATFNEASGQ
jgi:hypothetical protein